MSELNRLDSFNFNNQMLGMGSNNFEGFGLSASLMSGSLFGQSILPPTMNFGSDIFPPTLPFSNNFGDVFAQNLQQNVWSGLTTLLANYKVPTFDMSVFDLKNNNAPKPDASKVNNDKNVQYGNTEVTKKYEGTAEDLDKRLSGVLKGKGSKFIELQEKTGINAAFLASIACLESGNGKSNAAKEKNNVAGIMTKSSNYMKLAKFNSVDECLESMANNLKRNYVDRGLSTVAQIHRKYCPVGAANDPNGLNGNWGNAVSKIIGEFNSCVA